jgi:diphthamide synthase (EF-2-diphthine--ammonia ligase)
MNTEFGCIIKVCIFSPFLMANQFLDEMDSYMYQTVGHDAIDLYSEAMGLPLFRRTIQGNPVEQGKDYNINEKDEVEDLYKLLKDVMVGFS